MELETLALRVTSVAALALLSSALLFRRHERNSLRRLLLGFAGLGVGTVFWHAVICLFGAPLNALVVQTLLLALLLASLTTAPAAVCLGLRVRAWVDVTVNLRVRSGEEAFLASSAIGAALGAYVGALPIPLDWDRPWQQWPLTCVFGALGGYALGAVVGGFSAFQWQPKAALGPKTE